MDGRGRVLGTIERIPLGALVAGILAFHVVLSLWQAWSVQINDDGILYVRSAEQFLRGDFQAARALQGWFGFPLLMAVVSKITTLPPEFTGKAANIIASAVTLWLLLRMTWMQKSSKLAICVAAALLFGNYAWNDTRGALTRDHLFICFVVISFFFLFLDQRSRSLTNKVCFAIGCVVASFFRKEAAALLVMVPALLVAWDPPRRWLRFVGAMIFISAAAYVVVAVAHRAGNVDVFNLLEGPSKRMAILGDQILAPFAERRAPLAYVSMIIGLVTVSLFLSLGPLSVALAGWGLLKDKTLRHSAYLRLFLCYLATALVALSAHTFYSLVFEVRYGLFLGLLLSPFSAIVAARLIEEGIRGRIMQLLALLAGASLLYGLVGALKIADASRFNLDAAAWLRANVQPGAKSLSNNNQISYYGNLESPVPDPEFLLQSIARRTDIAQLRDFKAYDVVVIRLRKDQTDQIPKLDGAVGRKPQAQFQNRRGDVILIYQPHKT
jgi:hypothetical protein